MASDCGGTAGTDARAAFLLQAVCDAKEKHGNKEAEEEEKEASFRFLKTVRAFRLAKLTTAANDDAAAAAADVRKRPGKAGQQRKHQHGLNNNRRSTTAAASAARAGAMVRSVEDVSDAFAAFELLSEVLGVGGCTSVHKKKLLHPRG